MKQDDIRPETFAVHFKQNPFRSIGLMFVAFVICAFLLFGAVYFVNSVFNTVFRRCISGAVECIESVDANGPTQVCWCTKGVRWLWEDDPKTPKKQGG